jgi:hypothetical protein
MGEERKVYKVLAGKPKGKRPLGRPRHRWEDVVRMDLREIGWGGIGFNWLHNRDWLQAVVCVVMNLQVLVQWSLLVN